MARNAARRHELLDAALAVLAEQGARGLTFRAVDARGGLPTGTASNYFSDRDTLLAELGEHVHVRLAPGPDELAALDAAGPDTAGPAVTPGERLPAIMRRLVERVLARREVYLALLELRLEATRRPALHASLTRTLQATFAEDVARHEQAGLPGGPSVVALLHHAIGGLIIDQLTVPESCGPADDPGSVAEALTRAVVAGADRDTRDVARGAGADRLGR